MILPSPELLKNPNFEKHSSLFLHISGKTELHGYSFHESLKLNYKIDYACVIGSGIW